MMSTGRSFLKIAFFTVLLAGVFLLAWTMRSGLPDRAAPAAGGQNFFEQFVVSGGPVVWFVLLPMSVIMVYLAADYAISIRRCRLVPAQISKKIIEILRQGGLERLRRELSKRDDFVSSAIGRAFAQGKGDWLRMRSLVAESLQEQAGAAFRRIEWINLIGNVSPMVGLFGTVFGMIKLFNAIVGAGGQPQPVQLADGISVALVTTFWGLFIAIPAVAVYGVFANRIEALAGDAVEQAEVVMSEMRQALKEIRRTETAPKIPILQIGGKDSATAGKASSAKL